MWQIQFCTYRRWCSELLLLLSTYEPPEASRENADVTLKQRITHLWTADRCTENVKLTLVDKVNRSSLKITWSTGDGRQEGQRVSVNSWSTNINFCWYSCFPVILDSELESNCWSRKIGCVLPVCSDLLLNATLFNYDAKMNCFAPLPQYKVEQSSSQSLWKIKWSIWVVTLKVDQLMKP